MHSMVAPNANMQHESEWANSKGREASGLRQLLFGNYRNPKQLLSLDSALAWRKIASLSSASVHLYSSPPSLLQDASRSEVKLAQNIYGKFY